jgi:hypothetical protein
MTDASLRSNFHLFRQHRDDLTSGRVPAEVSDDALRSGGVLAVGLLTGGGFPGAAACVSVLLETRFPESLWPWTGADA